MRAAPYARILLAILSLLALATSASAECAWVLWETPVDFRGVGDKRQLYPTWGYEKFQACMEAAHNINQRLSKGEGKEAASCLPDTVDPRGPKGK
jgi:hypothetical protein